jgi:hypothetical protein
MNARATRFGRLLGALMALGAAPGFAVVIDDFTAGPFVVDGPGELVQTALDPAHVIGGARSIKVGQFGAGSKLQITELDQLQLSSTGNGYYTVRYGAAEPLGGIDLTQNGHDRLRLKLGEVGASFHPLSIYVNLANNSSSNGVGVYLQDSWDDLILEIPYARFPVPFTAVNSMVLDAFRNPPGTSSAIDSIVTAGPSPAGDFNRDGVVDGADLKYWQKYAGIVTGNAVNPQFIATADVNEDGRVDGADFLAWQRAPIASSADASVTPEPASLVLAVFFPVVQRACLKRRPMRVA